MKIQKTPELSIIKNTVHLLMMNKKTCEMKFSDPRQAREVFEFLRTLGVLINEPIREIELR